MTTGRFWRWTGATLAILALAAMLVAAGGWLWLRTSLPRLDGSITAAGIKAPVEIHRDRHGVPTIRAQSTFDAYFALGFVHAQDRLWQMESIRRLGAGRLAEVLGPRLLAIDRRMRTLGLYRLATATLDLLSADARAVVDAYTAGVNGYLTGHDGAWPLQFHLLGFSPEPWHPADSMVWSKLMATRLARNSRTELLRARLMGRLTPDQIRALWPPYP
ncbi:MAG: penicillin acylase family protein, partial [Alphaproteobacteria bacterium]